MAGTGGDPLARVGAAAAVALAAFFVALAWGLASQALGGDLAQLAADPEIRFALGFTLWTSVSATLAAAAPALAIAWLMARRDFAGKELLDTLIDLPLVLPPLVAGVALLVFFGPQAGAFFRALGLPVVFSPLGVVVAQAFVAFPFAARMFRQAFAAVDPRLEGLARTLGCRPRAVFLRVTLPLAWPGLASGLAMAWARTLGEFGATAMLAGVSRMKTETVSAAIFLYMSLGELKAAAALSAMLLALSLAILFLFRLAARRRIGDGA